MELALRLARVKRLWVMSASKSQLRKSGIIMDAWAGREAHGLRQPLFLDAEQFAERAVLARRRVERARMFGIVEVQEVDLVDPQRLQALLERAPRA